MSSIVQVSNRDMGYARLGPVSDAYICGIATAMEKVGYERQVIAGDIWMRYQPRRTGGFPLAYAQILATLPAASAGEWNVGWTENLDARYDQAGRAVTRQECQQLLANAAPGDPDFRFLHWLDLALCLCQRADRARFIQQDFMPAFSARFPAGRVIFIGTDSRFESRLPILRLGNYFQINGRQGYDDMRNNNISYPKTASALHSSGVVAIENALTVLVANFLPLRACMVGRQFGWRALYLFGNANPPVVDRGPFPREEIELQAPQFFLRGDDPSIFVNSPTDPLGAWAGRYRNTQYPGDDAVAKLIAFFIERFNFHIENRIEVCNHVDGENIDFISCFEKYLTLDRILLECIMVATATNPAVARLMTFAVLDKFQELCSFTGIQQSQNFHHFCTRPFLNDVLLPSFAKMPAPWDAFFSGVATSLYDDLYATIRSPIGVWSNYLVQPGGGVRIYREWKGRPPQFVARTAPFTDDEFVAEYVRAARNTHHGYVSDGDTRRRFACYGSISTAFLPDSFTQLPLLITLAEFINPQALSGYCWLDQGALTIF
jgi:hypothetical protein